MLSSKFNLHDLHKVAYKIEQLLIKNLITYRAFTHKAVKTSEEANKQRPDFALSQGVKALIIKIDKKNSQKNMYEYTQIVIPGDKKFSNSKLRTALNARSVYFVNENELSKITNGVLSGGVPPFGNMFSLDVYADKTIFENTNIIFNCGDKRASISITSADYKKIAKPILCDIV